MKKVYVLFNDDYCEIIAMSEDKSLLEEIMCDCFFEDLICESYTCYPNSTFAEIWDDVLNWYKNYMDIFESEVI